MLRVCAAGGPIFSIYFPYIYGRLAGRRPLLGRGAPLGLVLAVGVRGAWRGAGGRCPSALFGDPFSAGPRGRVRRTQSTQCARCWAMRAGGAGWPRLGGGRAAGVRARVRVCGCGACGGMSGWLRRFWADLDRHLWENSFWCGGCGVAPGGAGCPGLRGCASGTLCGYAVCGWVPRLVGRLVLLGLCCVGFCVRGGVPWG